MTNVEKPKTGIGDVALRFSKKILNLRGELKKFYAKTIKGCVLFGINLYITS